jgi:hypothetical protein
MEEYTSKNELSKIKAQMAEKRKSNAHIWIWRSRKIPNGKIGLKRKGNRGGGGKLC